MKKILFPALLLLVMKVASQAPMVINEENSAWQRWLEKPVIASRILDNMENNLKWTSSTGGAIGLADSRFTAKKEEARMNYVSISNTGKRSHTGSKSLMMKFPAKFDIPAPKSGRGWGTAEIQFAVPDEDWTKFNRISVWIYSDNPGSYMKDVVIKVYNDGIEKLPALFGQEGESIFNLENNKWNHIVWEIGNVARDKITRVEITSGIAGHEPEACDSTTFYFDDLALEQVEPDYVEGWPVWEGRIAYSHTGYLPYAPKTAILSKSDAAEFRIVDEKSGKTVLTKAVTTVTGRLGTFKVLDFSELNQTGSYRIETGGMVTKPFRIDPSVWEESVWKALNFYYVERCGMTIPGIHGVCHRDWTSIHDDKRIVINGGWHDAGDLTQGLRNTGEGAYAMFALAEELNKKGINPKLYERLMEEAQWGLDWILKTSFGDGYRNEGSVNSRRTNGIIGDYDDVTSVAKNSPKANFQASSVEAIAYRLLKDRDPRIANYSLRMAESDWNFAVEKMIVTRENDSTAVWGVSFDSGEVLHEIASAGIAASVELWKATGKAIYRDKAVELAEIIVASQQRSRPAMDVPLTGFFYTGPSKKYVLHYCHNGREQEPIAALVSLCEEFPEHPDYMKWYSAVVLHSEFLKTFSEYTAPYRVMPSSIYNDKDYLQVPETRKESFRQQVLNGIPLGKGNYLRIFPVWMDYRGHFGTILPQAQALNYAARLRGDNECLALSLRQMEWVMGLNPFSQSNMYGEGYDFPPLYTPSSGDIVGGLPVGIQTKGDADIPYWPVQNNWTYKEIWIHPVNQWLGLMRDLTGAFQKPVEAEATVKDLTVDLTETTSPNGTVTITATIQGTGNHTLNLRSSNLNIKSSERKISLTAGKKATVKWQGKTLNASEPWVALVVPDNDLTERSEVRGCSWER